MVSWVPSLVWFIGWVKSFVVVSRPVMAWFVVGSQVFDRTQIFKDVFNIDAMILIIHQFLINQWFLDIVLRYAEIWTVICKKQILDEAIWRIMMPSAFPTGILIREVSKYYQIPQLKNLSGGWSRRHLNSSRIFDWKSSGMQYQWNSNQKKKMALVWSWLLD